MGGQVDRFGQPIPATPGYGTILNPDGSQPQMRNLLRLGTGIIATDDPNSEATRLDIDVSVGGGVQVVDAVANLRDDLFLLGPSVDKIYTTKNYKFSTDTGGMQYRWDAADTTTDDGVLHIKNAFHSTGRFRPIKPSDGMINCQACGPKLADIIAIDRSFDPAGVLPAGAELIRISGLLRNAGWSGIVFSRDNLNRGTYSLLGTEEIGTSTQPWIPFALKTYDGCSFVSSAPPAPSAAGVRLVAETSIITSGYGPRYWTQTIVGGETTFAGVSDITGLSVGDIMFVRISKNNTDESGQPYCYFFGTIKTITPGSGTTGTIETWECVPEPAPSVFPVPNVNRLVNKHDMMKVTGFQDNTTIEGFTMVACGWFLLGYRNLTINCKWTEAPYFCINGTYGIGLFVPVITVQSAHSSNVSISSVITLALQYDTHIGSMLVYDMSPRSGTQRMSCITTESCCRGTRIDHADITINSTFSTDGSEFCGQTLGSSDLISVGMLVIRGTGTLEVGSGSVIECIDYKGNVSASTFIPVSCANAIIWHGQLYRKRRDRDYILPLANNTLSVCKFADHGITSGLRVRFSSMTDVGGVSFSDAGFVNAVDITSLCVAGQWVNIGASQLTSNGFPNTVGYNNPQLNVATGPGIPAGAYVIARHTVFEIDQSASITSVADTSAPSQIVTSGAPSASSDFISQEALDSVNLALYRAVTSGAGASDWVPVGSFQNTLVVSGPSLPNANVTIDVTQGSFFRLPAGAITALRTVALFDAGATDKQSITLRVEQQSSNYLIDDSASTLLLSVASGTKVLATFTWDAISGKFKLSQWAFFT